MCTLAVRSPQALLHCGVLVDAAPRSLCACRVYGYAIWGNSLASERKLVYATGWNGRGGIRQLATEELAPVPAVEPVRSVPGTQAETAEAIGPEKTVTQGSLFDEL